MGGRKNQILLNLHNCRNTYWVNEKQGDRMIANVSSIYHILGMALEDFENEIQCCSW